MRVDKYMFHSIHVRLDKNEVFSFTICIMVYIHSCRKTIKEMHMGMSQGLKGQSLGLNKSKARCTAHMVLR